MTCSDFASTEIPLGTMLPRLATIGHNSLRLPRRCDGAATDLHARAVICLNCGRSGSPWMAKHRIHDACIWTASTLTSDRFAARGRRRVADRGNVGLVGFHGAALEYGGAGDKGVGAGGGQLAGDVR